MRLDDLLATVAVTQPVISAPDISGGVWSRIERRRRRFRDIGVALHTVALVGAVSCSFWVSHSYAQTALNQAVVALTLSENAPLTAMGAY